MADFSKIGRNNKNRGRAFERFVAEKLGWTRVPYSGAMKEWGGADVVDGFYQRNGYWAAECKTQQPNGTWSISIKHKWVMQMLAAEQGGRQGIIITRNVGQRKIGAGAEPAYVFVPEENWEWFAARAKVEFRYDYAETFTRGKGHNFVVDAAVLDDMDKFPLMLKVIDKKAEVETIWYVITLDRFADIVKRSNLYVPEAKNA